MIGDDNVAVPTHFYKIVVDANSTGHIEALAFTLPKENLSGHHYSEYLASINEIEADTGLDFLSALESDVQNQLESKKAEHVW